MKTLDELDAWIHDYFDCLYGFTRGYMEFPFDKAVKRVVFSTLLVGSRDGNDASCVEIMADRFSVLRAVWDSFTSMEEKQDGLRPLLLWRSPLRWCPENDKMFLRCRVGCWDDRLTKALSTYETDKVSL